MFQENLKVLPDWSDFVRDTLPELVNPQVICKRVEVYEFDVSDFMKIELTYKQLREYQLKHLAEHGELLEQYKIEKNKILERLKTVLGDLYKNTKVSVMVNSFELSVEQATIRYRNQKLTYTGELSTPVLGLMYRLSAAIDNQDPFICDIDATLGETAEIKKQIVTIYKTGWRQPFLVPGTDPHAPIYSEICRIKSKIVGALLHDAHFAKWGWVILKIKSSYQTTPTLNENFIYKPVRNTEKGLIVHKLKYKAKAKEYLFQKEQRLDIAAEANVIADNRQFLAKLK